MLKYISIVVCFLYIFFYFSGSSRSGYLHTKCQIIHTDIKPENISHECGWAAISGGWLQKPLSGRKLVLLLHLGQQVRQLCLLTPHMKHALLHRFSQFRMIVNFSPLFVFSHSLINTTCWFTFLPSSILFLKSVDFASCHCVLLFFIFQWALPQAT